MCSSFHPLYNEEIKTFTLDPLIGDNFPCVRVTIGCLRGKVVAVVPMLTDCPLSGTKGHYAA
jgi:hypothetical protein